VGGISSDITARTRDQEERARLYAAAEAARSQAEAASRAKDEFLAMLGHELRNPLAPILTALELMRLRCAEATSAERAVIERQVRHMVRLVDDLLDVSRITRGKVELKRQPLETADVVAKAVELVSPLLEQRAHHLSLLVPRAGLVVDGDPARLAQVFSNLLSNAAKYTERGGRIVVAAAREGSEVVVRVRDDGDGIAPELLPRVFELFTQGARPLDRAAGGLGLGLTVVRSLVALHGGTVTARSDGVGRGSEIEVRLPLGTPLPPPEIPAEPPPSPPPVRSQRVLVVDDNEDAGQLLAEALREIGCEAHVTHDGPSAIAAARELEPDIALLDIGLPVMDGYEVARRLRADSAAVRLVAITGYGQDADRRRSREAGFDRHLVKPIDLESLQRVLDDRT
jgi:CheY-like chemotaxis protein/two-component sensor histidine kinase